MARRARTLAATMLAASCSLYLNACADTVPTGIVAPEGVLATRAHADSVRADRGIGIVRPRGFDGSDPPLGPMTSHNGSILPFTNTYAIFVGPSWNNDPGFTADKITSVQSFFQGFAGSNYANILTEYGATTQSTFRGAYVDNGAPPDGSQAWLVGGYVCGFLNSHGLTPDPDGFYAVYTTQGWLQDALGYHTTSSCGSVTIHFAIIFNTDDRNDVPDGQYHSDHAAEIVDITAHELAETITDASPGNGWFTVNTYGEIADKCNFTFGPSPYVTLSNGSVFKLQGEWSNRAYQNGSGFSNRFGELGCVNTAPPTLHVSISGRQFVYQSGVYPYSASVSGGIPGGSYYYVWQVHYCYYQAPCTDGPYYTFNEGYDVSSVSLNYFDDDYLRDITVTVQEYINGNVVAAGSALITVDGPMQ